MTRYVFAALLVSLCLVGCESNAKPPAAKDKKGCCSGNTCKPSDCKTDDAAK